MDKVPSCNLEFVREDDYVEYFVFPHLPDNVLNVAEGCAELEQLRSHLQAVKLQCEEIVAGYVQKFSYIWHKDEFQLQARTECAQERLLNDEPSRDAANAACASAAAGAVLPLPPHLHGVTHFGDNIADEWFVVHLLSELTRQIAGCIVRVIDSDGEFLLIEAADVLPKWANPDTCEQRVYIADGHLQLVQNSPSNTAKPVSVSTAVAKIRLNPTLYRVSKEIQSCIEERLKEFRAPTNAALHYQIVRLPLGVAALLKERPALISAAVRAFCERDPIDLKACRTMRFFPPEQCVRTNVCFTRCLYAMLMHSNYKPDRKIGWNLSGAPNTEQHKEELLGVKIASGFEILASQAKIASSEENEPAWRAYLRSLSAKGYFRGNLEGSEEYKRLLDEARTYYRRNNERFRTAPLVGKEILELLQSVEVSAEQLSDEENNLRPSDSDDWLNISADQLDALLLERYGPKKLYTANGDINADEFTKNLAEFLEKQSDFDGVDNVDSDDDTEDADGGAENVGQAAGGGSKRKADFKAKVKKNNSMRRACKQNSVIDESQKTAKAKDDNSYSTQVRNFLDFVIPEDNWDSNSDMSDYEDDDDLERNFEAMANSEMNVDMDIRTYMAQMDRELAKTTIGQSFETKAGGGTSGRASTSKAADDDFDDIESFEPININVNTLKNLMDSYKSQIGGAGPVTNLLSAMGAGMSAAAAFNEVHNAESKDDLKESTV